MSKSYSINVANDVGTKFYVILDGNVCILVNTP